MTHSEIRSRGGIPSIKSSFLYHQLRWLDHVTRLPDNGAPHRVLYGQKKRFKSILENATIHFSDLRLLHPTALPMPTDCHILTLNMIMQQLSDAMADTSMLQRPAHIETPLTSVHFVADLHIGLYSHSKTHTQQ